MSKNMVTVNIKEKLSKFNDYWNPRVVGEFNGQTVKLVKVKGEFVWHDHKDADELFIIIKGQLIVHFRDKDVLINEGEFIVIPKGIEHKPEAKEEVHMINIDPKGTVNTGDVKSEHTVKSPGKI